MLVHFGDLDILCGCCTDNSKLDPEAMVEAMKAMLEVLGDEALNGLHIQFAHLTGVGNFPGWTQKTFSMLIDAYQNTPELQDVEILLDVFSACANTCGNIPAVTDQDLAIMAKLLEVDGQNDGVNLQNPCLWSSQLNLLLWQLGKFLSPARLVGPSPLWHRHRFETNL